MPSLQDVQRNQAVQSAQQGVFDPQFDPDAILQEVAQKDLELQQREQELMQREQMSAGGAPVPQGQPMEVAQNGEVGDDEKLRSAVEILNEIVMKQQAQGAAQMGQPQEEASCPASCTRWPIRARDRA